MSKSFKDLRPVKDESGNLKLDLLRKAGVAAKVITFPNTDVECVMRVLTKSEVLTAQDEAARKVEQQCKSTTQQSELIDNFFQYEVFYRALRTMPDGKGLREVDPKELPHFFSSAEEVGECTADECVELFNEYTNIQKHYAGIPDLDTPEQFETFIEELKKNSATGNYLSSHILKKLVRFLIANMTISQTENGSTSMFATVKQKNLKNKPMRKQGLELKEELEEELVLNQEKSL